ncbi:hypothetical protein ACH4T9_18300 [Micromonospora sp. NPDC020750]|uniref:hypothetical protein n=1 Tax=unclassified Micromonospora TaxID=2617518 RepID=UPI00378A760B
MRPRSRPATGGGRAPSFTAGKLGEFTAGKDGVVVLGDPFTFTAENIDRLNF